MSSDLFRFFTTTQLTDNCRFANSHFAAFTQNIALAVPPVSTTRVEAETEGEEEVELPETIHVVSSIIEAQRYLHERGFDLDTPKVHMAPHIVTVTEYNDAVLSAFRARGMTRVFNAFHEIERASKSSDFLSHADAQNYTKGGIANSALELFLGMPVMLLRNLFPSRKLFNGSILYVENILDNEIVLRPGSGPWQHETISVPRFRFQFTVGTVKVTRFQFPLAAAYSCSISKSQGQTVDAVILDLSLSCFLHGQLYVALSRCRDEKNIVIVSSRKKQISIVYKELLRRAGLK